MVWYNIFQLGDILFDSEGGLSAYRSTSFDGNCPTFVSKDAPIAKK